VDGSDLVRAINNPNSDVQPFGLRATQVNGQTATFSFNFKQFCTGAARVASPESLGELTVTVLGNPTLGEMVEVVVSNTAGEPLDLLVSNSQGQPLSQVSVSAGTNTVRRTVELGRSVGMYLLQVSTPTRTKTVKVVRQ